MGHPETAEHLTTPSTARSWRRLVVAAGVAYVAATTLGVLMRMILAGIRIDIPFDHLLHSHSHTLYFGWAGIGVLIGAMAVLPRPSNSLTRVTAGLAALSVLIYLGFLRFGYNPVTIAISTVVMFTWYVATWIWWRRATSTHTLAGRLYRLAFVYLLAASGGVWALAFLQASGRGTPLSESLAIHAFLLGFAWFLTFGVIGLTVARSEETGLSIDESRLGKAIRWWGQLAFLTFPLGVTGGPEVAWLGPAARAAGVLLLYPAWVWARQLWVGAKGTSMPRLWRLMAVWFGLAALGTATVAILGSDALLAGGRNGVVFYLHVLLLGFVTTILLALLAGPISPALLDTHGVSLAVMLAGITVAGMGAPRPGAVIALIGALVLWGVGIIWTAVLALSGRRHQPPIQVQGISRR